MKELDRFASHAGRGDHPHYMDDQDGTAGYRGLVKVLRELEARLDAIEARLDNSQHQPHNGDDKAGGDYRA